MSARSKGSDLRLKSFGTRSLVKGSAQIRSVPVARWIRKQSGGRTKLVRVGHPRMDPKIFDLVITTRQYPVPPDDNVVLLPLAMSRYRTRPVATPEEQEWLNALPRPHLLMTIGGATKYWKLSPASIEPATRQLCVRSSRATETWSRSRPCSTAYTSRRWSSIDAVGETVRPPP